MFKAIIYNKRQGISKKTNNPYYVFYVTLPNGMPVQIFVNEQQFKNYSINDEVQLTVSADFQLNARVVVVD